MLQFDSWLLLGQIVGCLVVPSLSVLLEFFISSLYSADNCWLQFCYLSLGHMFLSLDNKIQGFVTDVSYVPYFSQHTSLNKIMARLKQFSITYTYIYMYSICVYPFFSFFFFFTILHFLI